MTTPSHTSASWTRARKALVREANRCLSPLETLAGRAELPIAHRPLFVVGPPRSGTTLVSQIVTAAFDVAYVSNLHNALWGAPSWVAWLLRAIDPTPPADFRSDLGNTRAWLGHSEAPSYWLRFLPPSPHHLEPEALTPARRARMRVAVARFVRAAGKPVLFKTVVNTGRIRPIAAALPEALFVVVRRDPVDVAHSLLEARRKSYGSYEPWWSLEPPDLDRLRTRPVHEQVIEQVIGTYERIDEDRRALGDDRFVEIGYEAACADPRAALAPLAAAADLVPRAATAVPASFPRRRDVRIPAELQRDLVAYAARRADRGERLRA